MTNDEKDQEIARLKAWVDDLQSGMYINCVYCGHRYGPKEDTPVAMADVLKEHIEQCLKHPMSALKARVEDRERLLAKIREGLKDLVDLIERIDAPSTSVSSVAKEPCPTCTQKTKDGVCGKPAVAMVHWPGSDHLPLCEDHTHVAKVVAGALGFAVHFEEIPQ